MVTAAKKKRKMVDEYKPPLWRTSSDLVHIFRERGWTFDDISGETGVPKASLHRASTNKDYNMRESYYRVLYNYLHKNGFLR